MMQMTTNIIKSAILATLMIVGVSSMSAQSYYDDDIYYNPEKAKKEQAEKKKKAAAAKKQNNTFTYEAIPGSDDYQLVYSSNGRNIDVDEYNRRYTSTQHPDSTSADTEGDFAYTRRIERFYNPEIVSGSKDEELRDYYYSSQAKPSTTINLYVSNDYGWYDPFYYDWWCGPWYNPWRYSYWGYYDPWYGPYYSWNFGWGPSWSFGWGGYWPSYSWGWGPVYGGGWNPAPAYRPATGGMITHRPVGSHSTDRRYISGGRNRGNSGSGNYYQPSNNNYGSGNNVTSTPSPQRRGGNVNRTNDYNSRPTTTPIYNNNSSWGNSGSNRSGGGGSSFGSGSFGGGRAGGGSHSTGGRRR